MAMVPCVILFKLAHAEEPVKQAPNSETKKKAYPTIVETTPKIGASEVDPSVNEIRVTFDRDMLKGMSWTGAPPNLPPIDKYREAKWIDKRTCVLPVSLAAGSYYRVGINSSTNRNFQSADRISTPPSVIYFTTKGGNEELLRIPKVATFSPGEDSADVDPAMNELTITFDIPMSGGMSCCRTGGGEFPNSPQNQKAKWTDDGLTFKLPVKLEANQDYAISLNDLNNINFQSKSGVPLAPVIYKFHTRESK
jgi:hypothetical protein